MSLVLCLWPGQTNSIRRILPYKCATCRLAARKALSRSSRARETSPSVKYPCLRNRCMTRRRPPVQIPVLLVAVVPVYNVPGGGELRFSGKILAQIYLGAIKNWNDPAISRLNPDVTLPDLPIEVFHRDEGRGTSYIFTDFLFREKSGVPLASRKKRIAQVAGRHDGEAQCRYGRESESHARRHRVRGAELRHTGISGFRQRPELLRQLRQS